MAILRSTVASALLVTVLVIGTHMVTTPAHGASEQSGSPETPSFVQVGKRYAFTWSGGGPSQTYTVKAVRRDGWVLVDVAEETVNPAYYLVPGELPTRWLNVALAISIQEMRPFVQ